MLATPAAETKKPRNRLLGCVAKRWLAPRKVHAFLDWDKVLQQVRFRQEKTEEKSEPLPAAPVAVVSPNGAVPLGTVSICNSKTRFWSIDATDLDVLSGRFPFVLICNSWGSKVGLDVTD